MAEPLTIFVPAAGLGERLRPITNHIPKGLLPILGRPLIGLIIERLVPFSSGRIGVNLHYKGEMIREWAKNSPFKDRITFFPEDPVLGTGGALKNAEAFLSGGHFLVHNSDILLDIDFGRLIEAHLSSGNIATLATHDYPRFNNVLVDENGRLLEVERPGAFYMGKRARADLSYAKKAAFTGVALYSPRILDFLPEGVSHVTDAWVSARKAGHKVQTLDFTGNSTGPCWNDIGTPATYAAGILEALCHKGETIYYSPDVLLCGSIEADGYIVLESGCRVADGSRLRNCIIMPGARVSGPYENRVIGPDYEVPLTETEFQPPLHAVYQKNVSLSEPLFSRCFGRNGRPSPAGDSPAILVGFGGSDRRYYRVREGGTSAILMECLPGDPDFERHIEYTRFFALHGVPVPELLAVDYGQKRALFEDLGDTSLYSWLKFPRGPGRITEVYKKIMEKLAALHTRAYRDAKKHPLLREKIFDYEHLRWESAYFLERFVSGLMGIKIEDPAGLEDDFGRLASLVDSFPKAVVHRDFQSQNIMIAKGLPRVIDYQGARIGPPAYDLASILWDPYHRLEDGLREDLLSFYISLRKEDKNFSEGDFRKTLLPCRLQRHMQALGAYGFLSRIKGKKYFLKHIPEGLRLLKEDMAQAEREFPALSGLIRGLDAAQSTARII